MIRPLRIALGILFALGLLCVPPASFGQAPDWKQIQAPPLRAFHPPSPVRIQLSNGLVIFLLEDHELPLIRGTAQIRGASRRSEERRVGKECRSRWSPYH